MNWFFGILATIAAVLIIGIALMADPQDASVIQPVAAIILLLLLGFVYFIYQWRTKAWDERIANRIESMAKAGSAVQVSDLGLDLAGRIFSWPALKIDSVEFIQVSSEDSTNFIIERLLLVSAGHSVVLDSALLQNGRVIVDNAYRRLRKAGVLYQPP